MGGCSSKAMNDLASQTTPSTNEYCRNQKSKLQGCTHQLDGGSKAIAFLASQKGVLTSETEECEEQPTVEKEEVQIALNDIRSSPTQTNPPKLKVGYSSGGSLSSGSLGSTDHGEHHRSPSGGHLASIKRSISVEGDLCKGVVRIETDFGRPIEDVYEGVHDGPILGTGVSGIVREVKHRITGVHYAVKCLDVGLINDEKTLQALRDEITIMCQLDHPNIVRLEEVYENENEIFLIQELCTGGDLFDRLDEQSDYHYSEFKCARLVKQMLSAVRYLHSKNIIHCDLKLENFLFSSKAADSELRMIDFGLSKHFTEGSPHNEVVGTPYTVAPEILNGSFDEKVDLWALGVITFLLLCGETPFGGCDGENLNAVRCRILLGKCEFKPTEIWKDVSDHAKAFVLRLLDPNSENRPTAREAQRDPWFKVFGKRGPDTGNKFSPRLCQALIEFKEYSGMRKFLCEVLSFTLLPEQIVGLRQEFERVDTEGDGEISFSALKSVLKDSAEDGALGALTEEEVESIFDALRLRKTETKIRWHEFIAAGLSQCTFDERNLRLAFDRLDYDRKGFITIDDMKGLLGAEGGEEDPSLRQMWDDGLKESVCPLGQITYEDFRRFIKGQKKCDEPLSPVPKRRSVTLSMELSPLQSVPEGSISPQPKTQAFVQFSDVQSLNRLSIPSMGMPGLPIRSKSPYDDKAVDIGFPAGDRARVERVPRPMMQRKRSRSEGDTNDAVDSYSKKYSGPAPLSRAIGELKEVLQDQSISNIEIHKALYRKHREFRNSVMLASKLFDQKQKARKLAYANKGDNYRRPSLEKRASLVLKRGVAGPPDKATADLSIAGNNRHQDQPKAENLLVPRSARTEATIGGSSLDSGVTSLVEACPGPHNPVQVADASRRSGRARRPRQKTVSDISGMIR